jgi:hypothetical protein
MFTKLETIELEGLFGSGIDFDIYTLDSIFESIPCVYIITKLHKGEDGNFLHKIIYVGQTEDISTQIKTHHEWKCFNINHANCIGIFHEKDEAKRKLIESAIIKKYDPPCNE